MTLLTECPKCGAPLKYGGTWSTMVNYYGEDWAPPHDHDDNCKSAEYTCENGHQVNERKQNVCPVEGCGWKGKTDCFCSKLGVSVYEPIDESGE